MAAIRNISAGEDPQAKKLPASQPFGLGGPVGNTDWSGYGNGPNNDNWSGLAKLIGFGGDPTQTNGYNYRAGDVVSSGAGDAGPQDQIMLDDSPITGMSSGLAQALQSGGYSYKPQNVGGSSGYGVYDQSGNQLGDQRKENGIGAIKPLTMGLLGAIGGGAALTGLGMLGGGAAEAGGAGAEAGGITPLDATYPMGADTAGGFANLGADAAEAAAPLAADGGADAGTAAAWGQGTGLGGDTLSAMTPAASSNGYASLQKALGGVAGGVGSSIMGGLGDTAGALGKGAGAALGAGLVSRALTGNAPTAPNAGSLIQQQTTANTDAAKQQAQMNRVDTTTPFGFQKFGQVADPSVPGGIRYTQEIGLSPEQQKLYNSETGNQIAKAGIATGMQGRVADSVAKPLDLSNAGALEKAMSGDAFSADKDKVTQALFERLTALRKPQMDRDREALDSKLRNQGLMPGTEAYDNGMKSMLDSQNTELSDQADRALLAGGAEQTRMQGDARANASLNNNVQQTTIQQDLLQRQQPLAELNSFQTGNAPTLPTFQPFGLSSVAPTNTTAAAQMAYGSAADSYNAKIAQLQSLLNFGTQVAKP